MTIRWRWVLVRKFFLIGIIINSFASENIRKEQHPNPKILIMYQIIMIFIWQLINNENTSCDFFDVAIQ